MECSGSEESKGSLTSVDDCASQCKGVASMFIVSMNSYSCYCETSATEEGTCETQSIDGYRLYKYGVTNSNGTFNELQESDTLETYWTYWINIKYLN